MGITHIDTADFYGPHVTNQIIKEALHPYLEDLRIVTKIGSVRDEEGNWIQNLSPDSLRKNVHDSLTNRGVDALDVVNLRVGGFDSPQLGSILAEMQQEGLIKHLGISTVNAEQVAEAQSIARIVSVLPDLPR